MRSALLLVSLLVALVVSGCGGETTPPDTTGGGTSTDSEVSPSPPPSTATDDTPADGCSDAQAPAPREDGGAEAPKEALDATKEYTLTFATNCGTFVVTLDQELAPNTAASLVSLARAGFFDGTVFHRIEPGFVIQGGDPTASGRGGPGYQTVDAPPADAAYTKGVVAMAKTESEAPGTSGSQFFVVTGDDIGLPADYAIVGTVTSGLEAVELIGMLGDASGLPIIERVTVDES